MKIHIQSLGQTTMCGLDLWVHNVPRVESPRDADCRSCHKVNNALGRRQGYSMNVKIYCNYCKQEMRGGDGDMSAFWHDPCVEKANKETWNRCHPQ